MPPERFPGRRGDRRHQRGRDRRPWQGERPPAPPAAASATGDGRPASPCPVSDVTAGAPSPRRRRGRQSTRAAATCRRDVRRRRHLRRRRSRCLLDPRPTTWPRSSRTGAPARATPAWQASDGPPRPPGQHRRRADAGAVVTTLRAPTPRRHPAPADHGQVSSPPTAAWKCGTRNNASPRGMVLAFVDVFSTAVFLRHLPGNRPDGRFGARPASLHARYTAGSGGRDGRGP
jgi:hypothetical protein